MVRVLLYSIGSKITSVWGPSFLRDPKPDWKTYMGIRQRGLISIYTCIRLSPTRMLLEGIKRLRG